MPDFFPRDACDVKCSKYANYQARLATP